jgi:hypothetical protein
MASGQFFDRVNWKLDRHQFEFAIGTSNFLGDLGGDDKIGTNDLQDLEWSLWRLSAYVGYKRTIYKKLYLRTDLMFARVMGNDKLTSEPYRQNRNLHFRSNIWELSLLVEYELPIRFKRGHIYDLKGVKGWKFQGVSAFVFAGLGAFHFNPKAEVAGEWIALQPLHTEGQTLPGGPKKYRRVSISIPVGISISNRFSEYLSLGIEASYRYTFTDYIDDVSTNYYNPSDISENSDNGYADIAAYLSNPALGPGQGGLGANVTAPGQQRGDEKDDDGYMLFQVKLQKRLKRQPPKFKKKRRINVPQPGTKRKRRVF